jgi:hypothetical protein
MERPFYKLIILIIDNDNPVYIVHRNTWRHYMNSDPEILTLFLRNDPICEEPTLDLSANTLTFKGAESYIPGILFKTLDGFNFCLQHFSFDHILRTNISSFFVFPLLKERVLSTLPRIGCYAGPPLVISVPFASGAGFFISPDIANLLVSNRDKSPEHLPDDVAIGYFLNTLQIPICPLQRFDFTFDRDTENDTAKLAAAAAQHTYNFRVKNEYDRLRFDDHYMRLLLKTYYGIEMA